MQIPNPVMFYLSAGAATAGTILYHNFAKRIPASIDPVVSVMAAYVLILAIGLVMLPFSVERGALMQSVRQLGWVQAGIAVSVLMIELGFVMMYRSGWDLSLGNVVTGAVINVVLLGVGVAVLGETMSMLNLAGVLMCIAGVGMATWR